MKSMNSPEPGEAGVVSALEWNRDVLGTFEETCRREWLVTNGIGGFAAGTAGLANTRRYHGLLFAALRPPVERVAHSISAAADAIESALAKPIRSCEEPRL
jgi:hypothetical protein